MEFPEGFEQLLRDELFLIVNGARSIMSRHTMGTEDWDTAEEIYRAGCRLWAVIDGGKTPKID